MVDGISGEEGEPGSQALNWERRRDRGFDELVGLCRGVLADGALVLAEAQFLLDWIRRNEPVQMTYLGSKLGQALHDVLIDGHMDHEEEDFLVDLLLQAIGGTPPGKAENSYSSTLPFDVPTPEIVVAEMSFCFTGKFTVGTRKECETMVVTGGGEIHKYPKSATSYLVVGELGSRDWIHSTSGRKIEHALLLRIDGKPIKIVGEADWAVVVGV